MERRYHGVTGHILLLLIIAATSTACSSEPNDSDSTDGGTSGGNPDVSDVGDVPDTTTEDVGDAERADADTDVDPNPREIQLPSLETVQTNGFATSTDCSACHSNEEGVDAMRDSKGRPVGFYDLWQASMMANAARDPLWRAVVSAEMKSSPGAEDKIQDKCLRCHSPMAYKATRRQGNSHLRLDVLHDSSDLSQLAIDGVSCTACHQIKPDKLGTPASFTGHFEVTREKTAYGPFSDVYAEPMKNRNGFIPKQGEHLQTSGFCGSCHTLYTEPIDREGNAVSSERFPEQTPFLEWKNSKYAADDGSGETCQSCHEPTADREGNPLETQIARNKYGTAYPVEKVPERSPYGRHLFVGGNTLIPAVLRDHRETLNPKASDDAFDALIERVRRQLENRTASVSIKRSERSSNTLELDVGVEIQTGHKFPTGYPARRAWLHVRVTDGSDNVLFESGGFDDEGRIVGGDGTPLASEKVGEPIEPHHDRIESENDVQIYQSVMQDADGQTTWRLMRAATYTKDNRLLPKGWSASHPNIDDMAPVGVEDDSNFTTGGDEVTYRIPIPSDANTLDVDVALYYQPLSHRFAEELFEVDTPAVRDFEFYWTHADRRPETIDTVEEQIE